MTVIFPDVNLSPKFFASDAPGTLRVSSIFFTVQGEGPHAGRPAVFVRLAGCNLGAKGVGAAGCAFCDTDFRIDRARVMTFEEIQRAAWSSMKGARVPAVTHKPLYVVTGGEPTLQRNLVDFVEWTDWEVQVETNGMYFLALRGTVSPVTVVVSPKMGRASRYPKLRPEVLEQADCLKFVVTADESDPYHEVPDWALNFPRTVYVSPMAVYRREMTTEEGERASIWDATLVDQEATARNYRYAAEFAMRMGLRLSLQTHLFCSVP